MIVPAERLSEVVAALRAGEVAAIPTDTVYGLVARPDDAAAVRRLATLKGRDAGKPLQLLVDDPATLSEVLEPPEALRLAAAHWPGALTAVLRVRQDLALAVVTGQGTVGVRQPDDDLARRALREAGGSLAASSANRAGEPPATTAAEVEAIFPDLLVLDGGPRPGGQASTVVDFTTDPPRLLRAGPVPAEALGAVEAAAGGERD